MNRIKMMVTGFAILSMLIGFGTGIVVGNTISTDASVMVPGGQDDPPQEKKAEEKKPAVVEKKAEKKKAVEAKKKEKASDFPVVLMKTSMGDIKIELNRKKAPISVDNFLAYAKDGYYDGTLFHRVIKGFMIQGGGYTEDLYKPPHSAQTKKTRPPIKNEANNGLSNARGTIAMARTNVVDSATSQFFINVVNNQRLDYRNPRNYGYAVFGKVIEGMDVADKIRNVATRRLPNGMGDVPVEPVKILSVKVVKKADKK